MNNTVARTLRRSADEFGESIALTLGGEVCTFVDLERSVEACALALAEIIGDENELPLAVVVRPDVGSIVALLAANWLGRPVLAVDDPVRIDAPGGTPIPLSGRIDAATTQPGDLTPRQLIERGRALRAQGAKAAPGADASILMRTSGTTGASKTAAQPLANLAIGADIYRELFDVRGNDAILAAVPLAHSFGMVGGLWLALRTGARLIHKPAVPPLAFLRGIVTEKPRVVLGAPLAYDLVVRSVVDGPPDLGGAGVLLSSGSVFPPETNERFTRLFGTRVISVYGSTETGLIATARSSAEVVPGCIGRPAPGVEARLRGYNDAIVARGPAALEVRTRTMFTGYVDDAAATSRVLVDGWYRTGDVASIDDDGSLTLHGRSTAFVNVAGRKVNPEEVVAVLKAHPSVSGVRVYGRDAGAAGQHLIAEVVIEERVSTPELTEWCRTHLPAYMTPVEFIRVPAIAAQSQKLSGV